jgi:hypothetical protein
MWRRSCGRGLQCASSSLPDVHHYGEAGNLAKDCHLHEDKACCTCGKGSQRAEHCKESRWAKAMLLHLWQTGHLTMWMGRTPSLGECWTHSER